jgi:hypothetical protein
MPSNALRNFELRLDEVEQLLTAHTALLRVHRATAAAQHIGGLANVANVVNHLIAPPGPGRPPQIQALNKAAIALLSGHLQGFITDLYDETAANLLGRHVSSIQILTEAAPRRGNPNGDNIKKLFASLGFSDVLADISWQRCSNQTMRTRLKDFNELRNKIVHGTSINITKPQVTGYLSSWHALAQRLDSKLRTKINTITGTPPW